MFGRVRRGEPSDGVTTARPSCQTAAAQVWDASGVARSLVTVLSVVTVLLTSCSSGSDSLRSPTAVHPGGQLTPLLDTTLSVPRWFTATDGSAHLVYELLLTNAVPATLTLNAVEVRNADAGRRWPYSPATRYGPPRPLPPHRTHRLSSCRRRLWRLSG